MKADLGKSIQHMRKILRLAEYRKLNVKGKTELRKWNY